MHNQRNRRAAKARPTESGKPIRVPAGKAPSFPPEVAIPPPRGAVCRTVDLPATNPGVAALFAVPVQPPRPAKKAKPAARRRKAQRKAKALGKPPPRGPRLAPALPLPQASEPLVEAAPLAPGRSLAPVRSAGLVAALADWIGFRTRALWDRLGGLPTSRPAPRRAKPSLEAQELRRLRAENARLKRQLDAILALRETSRFAPVRETVPPA